MKNLLKKCKERMSNYFRRNISVRLILRLVLILVLLGTILYSIIYGSISDIEALYTIGIIIATALTTKWVDGIVSEIRMQKDKIRGLRKRIRTFLFLWDNEHRSLEGSMKKITTYLLDEIVNTKRAFTDTVKDELEELYALTNSTQINPSITKKNYEDKEWEQKSEYYSIENMRRIIELCENLKDIS